MNKTAFIINPIAGKGEGKKLTNTIKEKYPEAAIAISEANGHANRLAADFVAEHYKTVVAIGGDGTVNEVAQALINKDSRLSIIPLGSGNGLVRHLGIPLNRLKALDCVGSDKESLIDVGVVNGRYFFNNCGIGLDAEIAKQFNQSSTRGLLTYTKLTYDVLQYFKEFEVTIELPEKHLSKKVLFTTVANSNQFGNNAQVAPEALIDDGELDIVNVPKTDLLKTLDYVVKMFTARFHQASGVQLMRSPTVKINFAEGIPVHIDGEYMPELKSPLEFSVLQRALKVNC